MSGIQLRFLRTPLAASTLLLASCAAITPPRTAVTPDPGKDPITRSAYAGSRQRLEFIGYFYADCSSMGTPSIRFTSLPHHGRGAFEPAREPPAFPPANIRFACNKKRLPGTVVSYRPDRGFVGTDEFAFEWISPDGIFRQRHYVITIR